MAHVKAVPGLGGSRRVVPRLDVRANSDSITYRGISNHVCILNLFCVGAFGRYPIRGISR